MALLRRRQQPRASQSSIQEERTRSVPAIREMLARGATHIQVDPEAPGFLLGPVTPNPVTFSGATRGVPHVLSQLLATGLTRQEMAQEGMVRIRLSPEPQKWIFDPDILWRSLAGAAPGEDIERRIIDGSAVAQEAAAAASTLWYCRLDTIEWLVLSPQEAADKPPQEVVRRIQRQRRALRSLGFPVEHLRTRRVPESTLSPGVEVFRLAAGKSVIYWVRSTVSRIVREHGGAPITVGVELIHELLVREGLAGVVATMPRSPEEIRSRYAVRTVREMVRRRGPVARVFAETAYRSGELYRAMAVIMAGLPSGGQKILQESLGHKRWQQLYDHSKTVFERTPRVAPWEQWVKAAEIIVQDLAARIERQVIAQSDPAAVVVRQLYVSPRSDRFQRVWQQQISHGALVRALQEARLSLLRRRLRSVPRMMLLLAACGEAPEVAQRISAIYSRRGRRMYSEDLQVLDNSIRRGEIPNWEQLLSARQTVLRIAQESS